MIPKRSWKYSVEIKMYLRRPPFSNKKKKNEHVISTTVENVILGVSNKNAAVKITNCQLTPASSLPFIDRVDWCNPWVIWSNLYVVHLGPFAILVHPSIPAVRLRLAPRPRARSHVALRLISPRTRTPLHLCPTHPGRGRPPNKSVAALCQVIWSSACVLSASIFEPFLRVFRASASARRNRQLRLP